jgi:hypothetical protein
VDPDAPTWHVLREALAEATDVDGRLARTARALAAPGRLTLEFLRGRRAPYLGPVKLALLAGTALTATWLATRGVDARYYGYPADGSAGTYIATVVRGSLAGGAAVAACSWVLGAGRRRVLDDAVFALHLVAALLLWTALTVWAGAAWKAAWRTHAAVPAALPPLPYLLFLPANAAALAYVVAGVRRVHGGPWWAAALRGLVLAAAGFGAVYLALVARRPA